jgi:uncharacterized protein YneF (UPF0154 family)
LAASTFLWIFVLWFLLALVLGLVVGWFISVGSGDDEDER